MNEQIQTPPPPHEGFALAAKAVCNERKAPAEVPSPHQSHFALRNAGASSGTPPPEAAAPKGPTHSPSPIGGVPPHPPHLPPNEGVASFGTPPPKGNLSAGEADASFVQRPPEGNFSTGKVGASFVQRPPEGNFSTGEADASFVQRPPKGNLSAGEADASFVQRPPEGNLSTGKVGASFVQRPPKGNLSTGKADASFVQRPPKDSAKRAGGRAKNMGGFGGVSPPKSTRTSVHNVGWVGKSMGSVGGLPPHEKHDHPHSGDMGGVGGESPRKLNIVISGCAGRMGKATARQILDPTHGFSKQLHLIGGIESEDHPSTGKNIAELLGLPKNTGDATINPSDEVELISQADAVIEFSTPAATVIHADLAAQGRLIHIIGATGFTPQQQSRIQAAARHATIVQSSNMSLGLCLLAELTRIAAERLADGWDAEILDTHHRAKKDAPSGSALMLAQAVADARGWNLAETLAHDRSQTREPRRAHAIGIASKRGGSMVGAHDVWFGGEGEEITLSHRAEDRAIYARGALRACLWARGRPPGLYSMRHVLGFAE